MTSPAEPDRSLLAIPSSQSVWPSGLERLAGVLLEGFAELHCHPMAIKEADSGVYVFVNGPMADLFGRPVAEVIGCTDAQLLSAPRASALRAADHTAVAHHPQPSRAAHRFELRGCRRHFDALRVLMEDPREPGRRLLASIWTDQAEADRLVETLAAQRLQIEQEQRLLERLRLEAQGQDAAAPPVHAIFAAYLRREFDLSSRERREFVLMLVELDDPPDGEPPRSAAEIEALQAAVDRLILANTRAMDSTCRLLEARSAVLLSGAGLATAYSRAEALRQQCLRHEVAFEGRSLGMSVSIGLAAYPHTVAERDELLGCSLQALRRARGRGPGQIALAAVPFPPVGARGLNARPSATASSTPASPEGS